MVEGCWYTIEGVYQYGRKISKNIKRNGRVFKHFADEKIAGSFAEKFF